MLIYTDTNIFTQSHTHTNTDIQVQGHKCTSTTLLHVCVHAHTVPLPDLGFHSLAKSGLGTAGSSAALGQESPKPPGKAPLPGQLIWERMGAAGRRPLI